MIRNSDDADTAIIQLGLAIDALSEAAPAVLLRVNLTDEKQEHLGIDEALGIIQRGIADLRVKLANHQAKVRLVEMVTL